MLVALGAALAGCSTVHVVSPYVVGVDGPAPPDSLLVYSVFLPGDAGDSDLGEIAPPLVLLEHHLARADDSTTAVVFLGDNIYPSGLPPVGAATRELAEHRIMAQIEAVREFQGQVYFIPGNHDWGGGGIGGNRLALRRQELFVERELDRGNVFLPDGGFPGPVEVPLSPWLTLVLLDTQWWLEPEKRLGDTGYYELEQETEFLVQLDDVVRRNAGRKVVVAGHHPLYSVGEHGGYFPTSEDLFFLLPLSRAFLGTPQDLSNLKYRNLRDGLLAIFEQHEGLVYAGGHEHNLQYFREKEQHYIVSGSASKVGYVDAGAGAEFEESSYGFAVLRYYSDGSTWLQFWAPDAENPAGRMIYGTRLEEPTGPPGSLKRPRPAPRPEPDTPGLAEEFDDAPDEEGADGDRPYAADTMRVAPRFEGQPAFPGYPAAAATQAPYAFASRGTVTMPASSRYDVGPLAEKVLGRHYRDVWGTPVDFPVLDLARTAGGLTPIQRGGGLQTRSLRLQGADGDEYVLRSVDKDPERSVPEYLRRTFVTDFVQDQISAINPYGALMIPKLADAAGVYHTTPKLVYVPPDERLGIYRESFGDMLALFEVRPDEDQSDEARFGYARNVVGTEKMFEEIEEDNDDRVDERAWVRARLLDMLTGDWDRHKDQWRWAEFDTPSGKVFRPVPRDRDFAFFRFAGPMARLARFSGDAKLRRFSNFGPRYGDILGLNFNGAAMDRRLTASLDRQDWLGIADSLRAAITDQVIEEAVRELPPPVFDRIGTRTIESLKRRRDDLRAAAEGYYELLAPVVDVVGTDKHERFEVTRLDDGRTEVAVYKTLKEGDVRNLLMRRTFLPSETKEIRLYGFGGEDEFVLRGDVERGIRVRVIGGEGDDRFTDSSRVAGSSHRSLFYDTATGNAWDVGPEARVYRSDDPAINRYEPLRLEHKSFQPVAYLGYNSDDGVFLGGGIRLVKPSFRKTPYETSHLIAANYALRTGAHNFVYRGDYTDLLGEWDGLWEARALRANQLRSYYGIGNETINDRGRFQVSLARVTGTALLSKPVTRFPQAAPFTTVSFGPTFDYADIEPRRGFSEDDPRTGFSREEMLDKYFVGAVGDFNVDGVDTLANPRFGARWLNRGSLNAGVRNSGRVFAKLASEIHYFYSFDVRSLPQLTLGVRLGGATNIGRFEFYQANFLGGEETLRGFRRNRFAGRTSFYQNVDLRAKLFDFNAYLATGEGGVLLFFDNGRVWADRERSRVWHQGYGGGLWLSPLRRFILTGTLGFSEDGRRLDVSVGWLF